MLWLLIVSSPVVAMVLSLGVGRYTVAPGTVLSILLSHVSSVPPAGTAADETVVMVVRLPRVLLAALCGAGLSVAGAALQGLFRNPLVGPQVLGISSGAGFGGVLALLFGLSGAWLVAASFGGAWLALLGVLLLARVGGRASLLMLVLAGLVVGALFSALTSICVYVADPEQRLPGIVFWLLGSFASADTTRLIIAAPSIGAGVLVTGVLAWRIDVLSLGDEDARALGVNVDAVRWTVLTATAFIVAGQVAVSGIVGWVGLLVPQVARGLVGPGHRELIPASLLLGAAFLVVADTFARAATAAEIPLGVLTALVGAPVFALVLRRLRLGGAGE